MCLLSRNLYLIYSSVMYNLEGLWPYVGPQHTKKAFAYDGLVIISHVGVDKNLIFLPLYYMSVML
jgi:hypothetical protein